MILAAAVFWWSFELYLQSPGSTLLYPVDTHYTVTKQMCEQGRARALSTKRINGSFSITTECTPILVQMLP